MIKTLYFKTNHIDIDTENQLRQFDFHQLWRLGNFTNNLKITIDKRQMKSKFLVES